MQQLTLHCHLRPPTLIALFAQTVTRELCSQPFTRCATTRTIDCHLQEQEI